MAKKLTARDYVHLHNHTQFSLLDGLTKIPELIDYIKFAGMDAVAITDHGTMSGVVDFYKTARTKGLKPIIGIETYVAARKHTDKDAIKDRQRYHLVLLAMNNTGYKNLISLSTIANLDGYYYFPRIDRDLLKQYNQGLIVLSGCMGGEIGEALKSGQYEQAKKIAKWYRAVFGDRYYLEVQDHGHPQNPWYNKQQDAINTHILKLSNELGIPAVVTCDAHYLRHEDQEAHEVLLCVGTGSYLSDENRMSLKDFSLHVTDPQEIIARWGLSHPDLILNSRRIAERCNVSLKLGGILIPRFPVPSGMTEKSYLHRLVYQGLAWRYGGVPQKYSRELTVNQAKKSLSSAVLERTEYELSVIEKMGFNGYFLIIADFINWGKSRGIVFGPGRGSAAGSITAYALRITELDPLTYDLLFERFLNPDRISMPDIDIDIQDNRRDEVIQYCVNKYGSSRVANIVTFGRMAARNAVRDTARVLRVPYAEADRLAKMIPPPIQGRHIPLKTLLTENHNLKREYETNLTAKQVFDLAVQLEGTIRSHGVHAAGVVIAPDDIIKFTPLEKAQKGVIATQYSMGPIEELGLIKIDFLGLSNLTIIKNSLRIIKKVYNRTIDINNLPLDDSKTYELFQRGDTTGVFQLESAGMKRYLKELKPTMFEDIIAMVALYRPGPMQFIDEFIARKYGLRPITYPHSSMESALKNTYGILVYQEQVMQISKDVCGFTGGEADTLRKAIGKKNVELMAKLKDKMIEGGQKHAGISHKIMEQFWKQLEEFAAYCFNKSHAACYAFIAYQTAYLKAHYPDAFMAALMTSDYNDTDRLAIEISECKHIGIDVLPPDVNESFSEFAVVPGKRQIRFGLSAIKNVGSSAAEEILRVRDDVNTFDSLEKFFSNVNCRIVNRKTIESLIKAGAFDGLGDRLQLLDNIDILMSYASKVQKDTSSGQIDLFGNQVASVAMPRLSLTKATSDFMIRDKLQWERELLGLYLSQHPLEPFKTILEESSVPMRELKPEYDRQTITVGGSVNDVREITTKNGQKMAFIQLSDGVSSIEIIVFPSTLQQTLHVWRKDNVVLVHGKVSAKDKSGRQSNDIKIIADRAQEITLEDAQTYQATGKKLKVSKPKTAIMAPKEADDQSKIYIRIENSEKDETLLAIKHTLQKYPGGTDVVLVIGLNDNKQVMRVPYRFNPTKEALAALQTIVGRDNVALRQ